MTWVALGTPTQGLDAIGGPGLGGIGDPSLNPLHPDTSISIWD